jgi:hypothetical protein
VTLPRPLQQPAMIEDLNRIDREASAEKFTGKLIIQVEADYKDGVPSGVDWLTQRKRRAKLSVAA